MAVFGGHFEIQRHVQRFSGRDVVPGVHAGAIHNQRSALGIEEMVAHAEAFGRAPRLPGVVADVELGVHHARGGVERRLPVPV